FRIPTLSSGTVFPHNWITTTNGSIVFLCRSLCLVVKDGDNHHTSDKGGPRGNPSYLRQSVGPMNPISNIRPIHFWSNDKLTELQRQYCAFCEDTWKWLDSYWACHNVKFQQAKRSFLESRAPVGSIVRLDASADLSEFYSRFLKENQRTQLRFNFEWYRRIAYLSYLGILVDLQHVYLRFQSILSRDMWKKKNS
ncbi:uncharacterized protein DEA37_0008420, partial [Paragonimus westermani]